MASRTDLFRAVLDNLGVTAPGNAPANEDVQTVSARFAPTISKYESLGLYELQVALGSTNSPEEIPDDLFLALVDLLAFECAQPFGIPGDEAKRMQAEMNLRRMFKKGFAGPRLRIPHFWRRGPV